MTQAQIVKALAANPALLAALGVKLPKAETKVGKAQMLANKDKAIRSTFTKRGIKDVVLMDRTDPTKPFNVRPFGRKQEDGSFSGWLGQGRIVMAGEKAVKGLFHVSQTRELAEEDLARL